MPPLIEKWNQLRDTDKDLFPLLEVGCPFTLLISVVFYAFILMEKWGIVVKIDA